MASSDASFDDTVVSLTTSASCCASSTIGRSTTTVSPSVEQEQSIGVNMKSNTRLDDTSGGNRSCSQFPTNKHRRTTVTFSDHVEVMETDHIHDMSTEERADRWFTRDDFWFIKMDVLDHVKVGRFFGWELSDHNERTFVNSEGNVAVITMRGIRSEASSRQRRHDQQEATRAVLNEQMLQRNEGTVHMPEIIAMLYNLMSFSCQQRALEMGFQDARCVYGTEQEYQLLEETKNVLCEPMPRDSDVLCVEERFVEQLTKRGLCDASSSIEDWLFERYQRGQLVANMRLCFDKKIPPARAKSCVGDHVPVLDNCEESILQRV
ncbi:hypothetical protein IV203_036662 [Nitzschia inconspicua]|uniref:Uncharacterized protein n=1 Tax=Nitzschia inconspicua TaxID=303405 RepID=A0A9K3LIG6_9STRA|nr:hypothetical protein IV203_036662 [Nitzschia inconspicua]